MSLKNSSEDPKGVFDLAWHDPKTASAWRDRAVVCALAALVILPFLGSFGLWDPWETHYGEVGRQITERHDWISTWWGSHWQDAKGNQEGAFFFSKPILLMWMMAIGLEVFGVGEWGIRIGVALVSILAVVLAYSFGASVFRRRTGFVMAGVLLTSPFWFFLSRQAQTDMPFVGLLSVGMCFFMMGVFGKDRERPADKLAYVLTFGWLSAAIVPQVSLVLTGLSRWRGGTNTVMDALATPVWRATAFGGVVLGLGLIGLLAALRMFQQGNATKAKRFGLAGLAAVWLPLFGVLVAVLASANSLPKALNGWFVWGPVQAGAYATFFGLAVYLTFAAPVVQKRRLYLFLFYVFIGLATLAKGLLGFLLPGAVIFLYILFTREWRLLGRLELLRGILIFVAVTFPWYAGMLIRHTRGFWNRFFVHDHFKRLASGVHQLDTGSFEHFLRWLAYGLFPWAGFVPAALGRLVSSDALDEDNDESRATLMLLIWGLVAFTLFTLSSTKFHHYIFPAVPAFAFLVGLAIDDILDRDIPQPWPLYLAAIPLIVVLAWDIFLDPQIFKNLFTYKYDRKWSNPEWDVSFRWWFGVFTAGMVVGTAALFVRSAKMRKAGLGVLFASCFGLSVYGLNVYMPRLSDTWSQQGLWHYYYSACTSTAGPPGADARKHYCEEPVVAYKLNWRGETFYSQNEVIPIRDDDDFTYFLKQDGDQTFYGIMEYSRYRGEFQRRLPKRFKGKACVVYNQNQKFVLSKVPCAPDDPERKDESRKK